MARKARKPDRKNNGRFSSINSDSAKLPWCRRFSTTTGSFPFLITVTKSHHKVQNQEFFRDLPWGTINYDDVKTSEYRT